jgi:hypothetical protein
VPVAACSDERRNPVIHRVACVLTSLSSVAAAQPLFSTFDASSEAWGVDTRSSPAGSFALIASYTPDYFPTGGDPGGYIAEDDPDNNWSFFRAPPAWLGDRSAFGSRWLRYRTRTDADSFPDGRLVVLIGDGGSVISADLGVPPVDVWTPRAVRLAEGSWFVGANGSGAPATAGEITAVLADLETLYIGLEFGANALEERVGLDEVVFGACDADLARPYGQVTFGDISAFLAAFASNDPIVDYAPPFGQWTFGDISAFLAAFNGGCP